MNKYEIYVNSQDLYDYIQEKGIKDREIFSGFGDFEYIGDIPEHVNFFNPRGKVIDAFLDSPSTISYHCSTNAKKVTPEEFLIAIGYIEKPGSFKIPKIRPESIHYICEEDNHDRLSVAVVDPDKTYLKVGNSEGGYIKSVCLSPSGLIQLGSDLVKLGVQLRDSE